VFAASFFFAKTAMSSRQPRSRKRVLIIGAGFAGIEVAYGLDSTEADVTLIDRENYHLFQPLLYQVATAALSPADIAEPVRRLFRGHSNVESVLGAVTGISTDDRRVTLADGTVFPYDYLVVAAGELVGYWGEVDWE
jgi:NADH dehydrogenase